MKLGNSLVSFDPFKMRIMRKKISEIKSLTLCILFIGISFISSAQNEKWSYFAIDSSKQKWGDWDEPEWLRYFGLDFNDVNRDGLTDVISGRYVYLNPGGSMDYSWKRIVLDDNVDAIFSLNVDDDPYADIIAQALPDLYWYEAVDQSGTRYTRKKIAEVPATSHINSQGFERAQIIAGGKEELLIAGHGNIYCIRIPGNTTTEDLWPTNLIARNTSDEGIGVGDVDGDGDLDIVAGRRQEGEDEPKLLVYFENPGTVEQEWKDTELGESEHPIDRIEVSDLNNDNKADIVFTEERYPGLEPDANLYIYLQKDNPFEFEKSILVTQYSMNNLDVADMDEDGDVDIITNEHKGPNLELQIWKNDGSAVFTKNVIDTGKENHLGTKCIDIDKDGDLDIVGSAWDNYRWMHLWRNDRILHQTENCYYKEYSWLPESQDTDGYLRVGGRLDYRNNDWFKKKD